MILSPELIVEFSDNLIVRLAVPNSHKEPGNKNKLCSGIFAQYWGIPAISI